MWNRPTNQIECVFIRHGKTPGNLEHRYIGKTDESLSEQGKDDLLNHTYPEVEAVYISSMKRCLESAQLIYPNKNTEIISAFNEMDFGDFEGKNYIELNGNEVYQKWIDSNGILPFPNGESRKDFIHRVCKAFEEMIRSTSTKRVACVVHGGTIMAILSHYTQNDYYRFQCKNGDGYICTITVDDQIHFSNIRRLL